MVIFQINTCVLTCHLGHWEAGLILLDGSSWHLQEEAVKNNWGREAQQRTEVASFNPHINFTRWGPLNFRRFIKVK